MFSKDRILNLINRINKIESEMRARQNNPRFDYAGWQYYLNRLYAEFNCYMAKLHRFAMLKSGRVQIAVLSQIENYQSMLQ